MSAPRATPESAWYARPPAPALLPISWLYGAGTRIHRALYDHGPLAPERLPARVLAVGNVVAGGAGKTPVVAWLALRARAAGVKVCVVSRGYGGTTGDVGVCVSDGERVLADVATAGDEPVMLARQLAGVPVYAGTDRVALGRRAVEETGAALVLLDDGMQHHRIHKDALVAVVRVPGPLGNGALLPAGPLRESARALARADAVVLLGAPGPRDLGALVRAGVDLQCCTRARLVPDVIEDTAGARTPLEALRDVRVVVAAGIGRPEVFAASVRGLGARVTATVALADHARWDADDVKRVASAVSAAGAAAVVVTPKDQVKLAGRALPFAAWTLHASLQVESPARLEAWVGNPAGGR